MNFERLAEILNRYVDLSKPEGSKPGVSYVADKLTQSRVTKSILESVKDYQAFRLCYIVYLMQDGYSYKEAFEKTKKIYYIITDEVNDEKYQMSECDWCDGQGQTRCDECDGNRTVECHTCDGTGEVSDDGGYLDCDECGGDGEFETDDKVYEIKQYVWTTINPEAYDKFTKIGEESEWVSNIYEDELFKSGEDWILTEGKNSYDLEQIEVGPLEQGDVRIGGTGIVSKDNLVLSGISNRFSVMVLD